MSDAAYVHPGVAQSPAVEATTYQMTLAGLSLPLKAHVTSNAIFTACLLLLGHPIVAAWAFAAYCAIDVINKRLVERWLGGSRGVDPAKGFRQLAPLCAARISVYMAPITWLALSGQPASLLMFGIIAVTLVAIGMAAGILSRLVFWGLTSPVLAATALVVVRLCPPLPTIGILITLGGLALLLATMTETSRKVITAWHYAFVDNLALIPELEAARDQALVERAAADAAREDARQAGRAKSNFLATMSHEIRTPMNGVLGMAQLLRRDETNSAQRQRLDVLIESGEYLLSILNDILDVSKIDAGRLDIVPEPDDLRLFLERLVGFWGAQADEKGVALILDMSASVPEFALFDSLRLRQVLFNLIGNALKFTEEGCVEVKAEATPNGEGAVLLQLAIKDSGIGIAAQSLPNLFTRFSQAEDSEVRRFGGTGLGLSIAKQLIDLMGGAIWVESTLGVGSVFHINLPLALASAADAGPDHAEEAPSGPEGALKVLAVDDNAVNLLVLDQLLGSLGHEVAKASSGHEALAAMAVEPFDLVLMDIQMPEMNGVDVLKRVRGEDGPNRYAPVVALTADVTSGGRKRYLDLGFTEHASKPIQIQELIEAMGRAMAADARQTLPVASSLPG